MNKEIKWGVSFPLIGGFPIAAENVITCPPEYIIRYNASADNDSLYTRYINEKRKLNVPEHFIENEGFDFTKIKKLDIGISVPLCSGLSMLNASIGRSNKSRGADAEQNKWIYETAEFMLKYAEPTVYIGENAPGLYTEKGEKVRDKIYELAKRYDYSVSFYKTNSLLHGIPQKRERTFYFLWKSPTAPILDYYSVSGLNYLEYLNSFKGELNKEDLNYRFEFVKNNWLFKYVKEELGHSYEEIINNNKSMLNYIFTLEKLEKYIEWLKNKGAEETNMNDISKRKPIDNFLRKAYHYKNKIEQGLGVWNETLTAIAPNHHINALITKNAHTFLHPTEERTLTLREQAWLMGLPPEFDVDDTNSKVIGQNVPVNTASDMVRQAVKFINGELEMSDSDLVMQNNMSQKITFKRKIKEETVLF